MNINAALMEQLHQQRNREKYVYIPSLSEAGSSVMGGRKIEQALVKVPDDMSLEEFKHQVKLWFEIDNQVTRLHQVIKEKKGVQKHLSQKIMKFMADHNVEDLNTKEGKLRYKVTQTKPIIPKKVKDIQTKIENYFEHDKKMAKEVVAAVFDTEADVPKVEKVSLRRLKGVRIMNV